MSENYFEGSTDIFDPVEFKLGDVVQHQFTKYIGVVVNISNAGGFVNVRVMNSRTHSGHRLLFAADELTRLGEEMA